MSDEGRKLGRGDVSAQEIQIDLTVDFGAKSESVLRSLALDGERRPIERVPVQGRAKHSQGRITQRI